MAFALFLLTFSSGLSPTHAEPPDRDRRRTPIVEVFEKSNAAVVNISTTRAVRVRSLRSESMFDELFGFGRPELRERNVQSVGSGVVVHESGYIVTNAHVVAQTSDVKVTFVDKRTVPAEIVAVDAEHDLAVLKVQTDQPLARLPLGRSDDIMVGETVVAIGNPLGLQHTVTTGIVSAIDRDLIFNQEAIYRGLIQTDAAINPGNSGGPMINLNGELIGINTAIRGDAQNVGFAIPVDRLWELLPAMLDVERRERVAFGLKVSGRDSEVSAVRPGTPSARAGLKVGDRVVAFNGAKLRDGIDYYVHLLDQRPGKPITLRVDRAGRETEVAVGLEEIPLPDGFGLGLEMLGLKLDTIPADLRRYYELPAEVGLIVNDVVRNGPADRARIRPGDIILRVERIGVPSGTDLGLALENVAPGSEVSIEGLRLKADPPFFWQATVVTPRR